MDSLQEGNRESRPPRDGGVGGFFTGIALIAGSTAVTWAIWQWNDQTLTFVLWPFGLIGLAITALGILDGLLHAPSWTHRIIRFLLFVVVTSAVFTACLDFYINDLGYPRNSVFLNLIADLFR